MRYLSLLSLLACAALLACGQEQAPTASGPAGKASGGDLFDLFKAGGSTIVGVDSTAAETETPADTTATAPSDTTEAAVVDTVATVTGGGGGDAPSTSIRLSASPHTISEDAAVTQIVLTVTLNKALDADASVFISVDPNSEAVRDVDYSALFNPLLIIPAGSTSGSFSLLIDPTADRENEGNETITLTASTPGLTSGSVQITLSESAASERGGGGGGGGGCYVGQVVGPGQSCGAGGGTFRNVGDGCFVYTPVGSGRFCGGGGSFNGLGVSKSGDNFTITAVP